MNKIGVFYGSTTGTTEDLARRIAEKLDVPSADVFDVSKLTEALVNEYDVLVLGISYKCERYSRCSRHIL